jgi:D-alanine--D-alanine ligase
VRITLTFNLKTEDTEQQAELHARWEIDQLKAAIEALGHGVTPVEVSGPPHEVIESILASEPDLLFNIAEGKVGAAREAFYPGVFEQLGLPFTGSGSSVLHLNMDKQLSKTVVAARGVRVPRGVLLTPRGRDLPAELEYPLILKPNYEGSSIGITQKSVVASWGECEPVLDELLGRFPSGVVAEEFITGRELTVPLLQAHPGEVVEVVEHEFDLAAVGGRYNIYDFTFKYGGGSNHVTAHCPAPLSKAERKAVVDLARRAAHAMNYSDYARVDVRLREDGTPVFIEMNPLPSLEPDVAHMIAAAHLGLSLTDVLKLIIRSAARRHGVALRPRRASVAVEHGREPPRPTARELGVRVGVFDTGLHNALTDVKGVKVGHVTHVEDDVAIAGVEGRTAVRTGVTAILPAAGDIYSRNVAAGAFVLNGTGEMAGLSQILEWGWLESPILLCSTMSVGDVHKGVIDYMLERYPALGGREQVLVPVVAETDDSFLNDVRVRRIAPRDVTRAIQAAKSGPLAQGSVGAGTGMTTFDFAGGIGTASRLVPRDSGEHDTLGVLVQSNFGRMRNLTVAGAVVGRTLDGMLPREGRRYSDGGSAIVIVATDAPMLAGQLSRLAKRAALGLGRVGTFAASASGEFALAFSTGNRILREEHGRSHHNLRFISDRRLDAFYEAVIEATEEAVLNAVFCSPGMSGREGSYCPALPVDEVLRLVAPGT